MANSCAQQLSSRILSFRSRNRSARFIVFGVFHVLNFIPLKRENVPVDICLEDLLNPPKKKPSVSMANSCAQKLSSQILFADTKSKKTVNRSTLNGSRAVTGEFLAAS